MQTFKRIALKSVLFVLVFSLIYSALAFVTIPATSQERIWMRDFYQQEDLDIVFIGASTIFRSISPRIIDEQIGTNSFVLGSNYQKMADSYYLLQEVYKEHNPSLVVLDFNVHRLSGKNAEGTMRLLPYYKNSLNKLEYYLNGVKPEEYILGFLPGIYYAEEVLTTSQLIKNPLNKLTYNYRNYILDFDGVNTKYDNNGFFSSILSVKEDFVGNHPFREDLLWSSEKTDPEAVEYFEMIVDLCNMNGSTLLCVSSPTMLGVAAEAENYQRQINEARFLAEKHDVDYFNFILLLPELFDNSAEKYHDVTHLNLFGAEEYSYVFSDFLEDYLDGALDPDEYFCQSFDARIKAEPDGVLSVWLEHNRSKEVLEANATVGGDAVAEYEFLYRRSDETEFMPLREYGSDASVSLAGLGAGKYRFRVNSRVQGSEQTHEQYNYIDLSIG